MHADALDKIIVPGSCSFSRFTFHHVGSPNSFDDRQLKASGEKSGEPMNILNIALKIDRSLRDEAISEVRLIGDVTWIGRIGDVYHLQMLCDFCAPRREEGFFTEKKLRRITFIVLRPKEFPKYFTYRARTGFKEDLIYRHLEPALAFQVLRFVLI